MRGLLGRGLLVVLTVVGGLNVAGADYYVSTNGLHASPFDTWVRAATNIQAAITAAGDGDVIWVSNGVHVVSASNSVVAYINTKSVSLRGITGNPADVTIDGAGTNRGVYIYLSSPKTVLIDGLTITNGSGGDYGGGGVLIRHSSVTSGSGIIQNCIISGNVSRDSGANNGGGGLHSYGAAGSAFLTVVSNCTVSGNTATRDGGGGVYVRYGRAIVQDSRILNNAVVGGYSAGGVFSYRNTDDSVIRNCLVSGNSASYWGAGVYVDSGAPIENCILRDNTGPYGVGFFLGGTARTNVVRNSLIYNNTATAYGAAAVLSGLFLLENCTITSNRVVGGSGYANGGLYVTGATTGVLQNTILYFNPGAGGYSNIVNSGGAVLCSNSCVGAAVAGTGNTGSNPQFLNPAAGNFGLGIGSPCVNTGTNQEWMIGAVDMATNPRVDSVRGIVDMGCYECPDVWVAATNFYVATNGPNIYPYITWDTAATNIMTALDTAPEYGTIWVSNGVYNSAASNSSVVTINNRSITLRGASGNPADVIIDGGGTNRGVYVTMSSPKTVLIDGFTITNGSVGSPGGGGMLLNHAGVTSGTGIVQNCIIAGNISRAVGASGGGGLLSLGQAGSAFLTVLSNCTVSGNAVGAYGGGGVCLQYGQAVMQDCQIVGNAANGGSGGGVYTYQNSEGSVIRNCLMSGNRSGNYGGGVVVSSGALVENCTLTGNNGNYAGGFLLTGVARTNVLRNSLICNNTADSYAAAGQILGARFLMDNCTVASNRVPPPGYGYANGGLYVTGASTGVVQNSIVYFNQGAGGYSNLVMDGLSGTAIFSNSCVGAPVTGTGNTGSNPQFLNPGAGNFGLGIGSPCVNAGTNQDWMIGAVDMATNPRIDSVRGIVDMGCYECPDFWVSATDFYVATNGPDIYPYITWDTAATNIMTALGVAPDYATVWVSNGVYGSTASNSSVVTFNNRSITLRGASGNPADVIIDGGGTNRGIYITMSSPQITRVDGFTITNCSVLDYGAGVRLYHEGIMSGTGIVQNCVIAGNLVRTNANWYGGAGLYSRGQSITSAFVTVVSNCTIAGNWANYHGGGAWFYNARVLMQDCRILGNTAFGSYAEGGGIYAANNSEDSLIRNCLIESNSASYFGGGYFGNVGPRLENCTIQRNSGPYGVGLYVGGTARTNIVRGCLIRYNLATAYSAGLQIGGHTLLESCTIVSNVTPASGASYRTGGLEINAADATSVVQNCILYFNYGGGGSASNIHVSAGTVTYLNNCCGPQLTGAGNTTGNPLFVDATGGDFHLTWPSPCINKGLYQDWMNGALDMDGAFRVDRQGAGIVDIGCYEYPIMRGSVFTLR